MLCSTVKTYTNDLKLIDQPKVTNKEYVLKKVTKFVNYLIKLFIQLIYYK